HREILARTLGADLLIALYDPRVPNNRYASPNKLFEAMLCGKPIVVNGGTSMTSIVPDSGCGMVVPYGDSESFREAILLLKGDPALRTRLGRIARVAYDTLCRWGIREVRLVAAHRDLPVGGLPHRGRPTCPCEGVTSFWPSTRRKPGGSVGI